MLDALLNRFNNLSTKDQDDLTKTVIEETKDMRWIPSPGPQTDAYFCKADVLLYGGAGGGGKSDLGLGLATTRHQRSLVMRRKYTDLSFLTDRAIEIMGTRKGFNGSAPPRFAIGKNKLIEYGAAQTVGDELSWMGRPHDLLYCLEKGSKILLPDGSSCPIEKLKIGQLVQTLEGPKPVEHIFDKGFDTAVSVTAYCGKDILFQQVQGCSHSLLTNEGWVSHDTVTCVHQPLNASPLPKGYHSFYNTLKLRLRKLQESLLPLLSKCLGQRNILRCVQQFYRKVRQGFSFFLFPKFLETCYGSFGHQSSIFLQRFLNFFLPMQLRLHLVKSFSSTCYGSKSCVDSYAQSQSLQEDCLDCYSSCPRQCDEQPPLASKDGLFYLPQLNGVEQQTPTCFGDDVLGKIHKHIVHKESYYHPYTKEKRPIDASFVSLPLSYTPVGEKHLYDITVKDTNHYISYNGFVNKNCDEAAHFSKLRSVL